MKMSFITLRKMYMSRKNVINEYPELAKEMRRIVKIHVKQKMEKEMN